MPALSYPAHTPCIQTANSEVKQNAGLHEGAQIGLKRSGEGNQGKHSDAATQRQLIQLRQEKAELQHEISVLQVRALSMAFFMAWFVLEIARQG
jgi:hypothetical protein